MAKKIQTLNIGTQNVELAEYEIGAKGQLTLLNYGVAQLDAPLDFETAETILSPALLGLVRDTGIRPGLVAMSIPGQSVFTKFASVPVAGGGEKFEQRVRYEIEQGIPFPIDEMICDRQVLGENEAGDASVMIVAAKTDQVEALTRAVESAGFFPKLVDSAPGALTNTVLYAHPEAAGSCVIALWIGSKATTLIITEGDRVYTRLIPIGGAAVTKEISQAIGCTAEEAEQYRNERGYVSLGGVVEDEDELTDRVAKACRAVMTRLNAEIGRSINFYRSQQQGSAPSKIYLTGALALLPQLDTFFAEALGVEVELLNPFESIAVGDRVDTAALETDIAYLGVTAGLAAQAAGAARYNVNLLPPALVSARAEKARIPFLAVGGVALALSLVLVGLGFGNETSALEAVRDEVSAKAGTLAKLDREVTAEQTKLAEAKAGAETLRTLIDSRYRSLRRISAVRSSLVPGMWIHSWGDGKIVVRYWKDRVRAEGGKTVGEAFTGKLKEKAAVDPASVRIADMSSVGKGGACEQFTVEVKFK